MVPVLVITTVSCVDFIACVLFKPSIAIRKHTVSIYWMIVLLGALVMMMTNLISLPEVISGLTAATSINPLKILVLFLSMSVLSIFLDEVGFFRYLANYTLKKAKAGQKSLFLYLYLSVAVLTVFTSNDIIILTFTPFICYFAKNAKISPIPYLFAEFVAANTWSMMLIIGNPTNVYLATANDIGFLSYTIVMLLPTILAGVTAFFVLFMIFRKSLSKSFAPTYEEVHIEDKGLLAIGIIHLGLCTLLLVISSYIGLEMWLITLCFAVSLFICVLIYKRINNQSGNEITRCLKRAPWELVPFVISMFIIVLALDKYHVTDIAAEFLGTKQSVFTYGIASMLTANVVNNIPMSVLFSSIVQNLNESIRIQGVYASIIGSNIGAFLTPIGALAGIMWAGILKKHNVLFSFVTYVKYGVIVAIPTLLMALVGLWIVL